ncbi:MAG: metalloregulator ArsR/SmtB family transcription factor [Caulobacteraceae bacterium]
MGVNGQRAVEMLRAAGEPTRLRILALLAHEELAVMELGQVLDQSQPRVSRHLKLLTEAGLVERFPDGAWVFYRLSAEEPARGFVDQALGLVSADDPVATRDHERLEAVRQARAGDAAGYFARNAARWDEIRSLYVSEADVEDAILAAAGPGPFRRLIDLGTGSGRMLTLLGPRTESALGLDLSHQMLNVARLHAAEAGLKNVELRHGDIFATGLPTGCADLVVVHRVLHYVGDPARAVAEAARLVRFGGRLLIVDFAPHELEFLRQDHQHRRLGFSDEEIGRWLESAGLSRERTVALPPASEGLTVKLWSGKARRQQREAA